MQTLLFILSWIIVAAAVATVAVYRTRERGAERAAAPLGRVPTPVRLLIGLAALAAVVAMPIYFTASASDRLPNGAGSYTLDSSAGQREGRQVFRETCASCHTLTAANARGVYGPNLDSIGLNAKGGRDRVLQAIKNGGTSGLRMPKDLLEGKDADLVAAYVAGVAGK